MRGSRLFLVAVAAEAVLAAIALVWIRWRALPVALGPPLAGLGLGVLAAGALGVANYALLRLVPPVGPVREVRLLYEETLRPLFAGARPHEAVGIALAAGIGEELLFRGAAQAEWGLVAASVLFGVAHVGGRASLAFGAWVVVMGLALGGLAEVGGGVLAPVVAHAVYDAAAIEYIRRDRREDSREDSNDG